MRGDDDDGELPLVVKIPDKNGAFFSGASHGYQRVFGLMLRSRAPRLLFLKHPRHPMAEPEGLRRSPRRHVRRQRRAVEWHCKLIPDKNHGAVDRARFFDHPRQPMDAFGCPLSCMHQTLRNHTHGALIPPLRLCLYAAIGVSTSRLD